MSRFGSHVSSAASQQPQRHNSNDHSSSAVHLAHLEILHFVLSLVCAQCANTPSDYYLPREGVVWRSTRLCYYVTLPPQRLLSVGMETGAECIVWLEQARAERERLLLTYYSHSQSAFAVVARAVCWAPLCLITHIWACRDCSCDQISEERSLRSLSATRQSPDSTLVLSPECILPLAVNTRFWHRCR